MPASLFRNQHSTDLLTSSCSPGHPSVAALLCGSRLPQSRSIGRSKNKLRLQRQKQLLNKGPRLIVHDRNTPQKFIVFVLKNLNPSFSSSTRTSSPCRFVAVEQCQFNLLVRASTPAPQTIKCPTCWSHCSRAHESRTSKETWRCRLQWCSRACLRSSLRLARQFHFVD